jgi:hypothetical protein
MSRIAGMRPLISAILRSIRPLLNVLALFCFMVTPIRASACVVRCCNRAMRACVRAPCIRWSHACIVVHAGWIGGLAQNASADRCLETSHAETSRAETSHAEPSVRPKVQFRFRSIFAETSRVVTCHSSFPPVSEWAMPCLHRFPSRQPGFVLSAAQIFLQGIIGVEMLSGKLRNRCVYTEGTLWSTALQPTNRTASYCRRCLCMCARVPSRPRPSLLLVRVRVQDQTTGCLPSRPT